MSDDLFHTPDDVEVYDTAYASYNISPDTKRYYYVLDPDTLSNISTFIYARAPSLAAKRFLKNPHKYLDHIDEIHKVKSWTNSNKTLIYINNRTEKKVTVYWYKGDSVLIPIGSLEYNKNMPKEVFFENIRKMVSMFDSEFADDFAEYDSDISVDSIGESM